MDKVITLIPVNFASSGRARAVPIAILLLALWGPSHYLFKWLRKNYHHHTTFVLSILGCTVITIALIVLGYWLGERASSPKVRSLWSSSGGVYVDINFMWVPFALLSLGIWAGFLSGYVKKKTGL